MLAANNGHYEVAALLIGKGALVNEKSERGWTALMCAAQQGHIHIVKLLLDHNAAINDCTASGWSPLGLAAKNGHLLVVQYLCSKNADCTVLRHGKTARELALERGHHAVAQYLERGIPDQLQTTQVHRPSQKVVHIIDGDSETKSEEPSQKKRKSAPENNVLHKISGEPLLTHLLNFAQTEALKTNTGVLEDMFIESQNMLTMLFNRALRSNNIALAEKLLPLIKTQNTFKG